MATISRWAGMWVALLALSGCSGIETRSDYDRDYSFAGEKTYAWMQDMGQRQIDPRIPKDLFEKRLKAAVAEELKKKGFTPAAEETADLLVGYHVLLEDKVSAKTINDYYGYPRMRNDRLGYPPVMSETYIYEHQQGTLILDLADRETQKLVWRGSAQAAVDRTASSEKRHRLLQEAVAKIFSQFPPKK